MILHVLPGDAYVETFHETGLEGKLVVFREALIDGDLSGESLQEFWSTRERYLSSAYPENANSYSTDVAAEIEKLLKPGEGDEIDLWFEYELFCSVNYWFCLHLLRDSRAKIYRVAPAVRDEDTKWKGFGRLTANELLACYKERVQLSADDLARGSELWQAFKSGDTEKIRSLGEYGSPAFPYLNELTEAAASMPYGPKQILRQIFDSGESDLISIFPQFSERAGVYGLGDAQVGKFLEEMRSTD
jgi:hypothetical protein